MRQTLENTTEYIVAPQYRCPSDYIKYTTGYIEEQEDPEKCEEGAYQPLTTDASGSCVTELNGITYTESCGSAVGCAEFEVRDYLDSKFTTLAYNNVKNKSYYKADLPARQLYRFVDMIANQANSDDVDQMTVRHCALGNSKDRCEQFCLKFCVQVNDTSADLNFTIGLNSNLFFESEF